MRPRRKHQRFVRRLETEFVGDSKTYRAISSDFSRYGLFIRTNHAFTPGTELDITIHLPNGANASLKGMVMRALKTPFVSLKNGMGVELTSRDRNYIKFLREFDPNEIDQSPFGGGTPSQAEQAASISVSNQEFVIIACPACGVKNRVRREKQAQNMKCGKCGFLLSSPA